MLFLPHQIEQNPKPLYNTIQDIGFDYPTDNTLRPVCNLPEILFIDPLTSFSEIGITSSGKNYSITPNLVVLDGYTNKVVNVYKKIQDIGIRIKTTVSNHPKKTVAILLSSLMVICLLISSFNIANENIELKIILDEVFALLKRKEKISMLELSTCMEKMNRLMEICKKE
jgi:hypothetical protein